MGVIQRHHIEYEPKEWVVELNALQHRTISTIQRMNATSDNYAAVTNFLHAVAYEWNRIRKGLDTEE